MLKPSNAEQTVPPAPPSPYWVLLVALLLPGMGQALNNTPWRGLLMACFMVMLGLVTFSLAAVGVSWVGKLAGGLFIYALSVMDAYYWARYRVEICRRDVALPVYPLHMNPRPEDTWNRRYAADGFYYGTAPNDFLREVEPALPRAGHVLCLGEGEGRNAVFLAQCGHTVVAMDQSAVGLEKAQRLAREQGVAIATQVADLATWDLASAAPAGGWDGIVSIWCHMPAALRHALHQRMAVALKPGGVLVLEAYRPEQLRYGTGGPPTVDLLPTLAELQRDFADLALLVASAPERDVQEGKGHAGMSAVVQVLARRPV